MIKRLILPHTPGPPQSLVDSMSRFALDRPRNLRNRYLPVIISQWQANQMYVIRHNHGGIA